MNGGVITEYEDGGQKLRDAIAGLSEQDMQQVPVPGMWSIQQVVIHLLDSDLIGTDRMKRIIAEDNPSLIGFDQSKFAANLHYDLQPADQAVWIFDLNRRLFARVLRKLPKNAWRRIGTHNERGPIKLGEMLEGYVKHLEHHLKFVYQKREKLGK